MCAVFLLMKASDGWAWCDCALEWTGQLFMDAHQEENCIFCKIARKEAPSVPMYHPWQNMPPRFPLPLTEHFLPLATKMSMWLPSWVSCHSLLTLDSLCYVWLVFLNNYQFIQILLQSLEVRQTKMFACRDHNPHSHFRSYAGYSQKALSNARRHVGRRYG